MRHVGALAQDGLYAVQVALNPTFLGALGQFVLHVELVVGHVGEEALWQELIA